MSALYVTEYAEVHLGIGGKGAQIPVEPPLADYTVAIGGGSTQSPVFNSQTQLIRLHSDLICSVSVGLNPIATSTTGRMVAGQTEYRGIPRGTGFQVAVISNS